MNMYRQSKARLLCLDRNGNIRPHPDVAEVVRLTLCHPWVFLLWLHVNACLRLSDVRLTARKPNGWTTSVLIWLSTATISQLMTLARIAWLK